jgi:hypothetical protein
MTLCIDVSSGIGLGLENRARQFFKCPGWQARDLDSEPEYQIYYQSRRLRRGRLAGGLGVRVRVSRDSESTRLAN